MDIDLKTMSSIELIQNFEQAIVNHDFELKIKSCAELLDRCVEAMVQRANVKEAPSASCVHRLSNGTCEPLDKPCLAPYLSVRHERLCSKASKELS